MKPVIPILGAAAVASLSACAHVPPPETGTAQEPAGIVAEQSPAEQQGLADYGQPAQAQAATAQAEAEPPAGQLAIADEEQTFAGPAGEKMADEGASAAKEGDLDQAAEGKPAEPTIEYKVGDVAIGRFVLARSIEDRQPVDELTEAVPGERVYAFVRAVNGGGEPYDLHIRWASADGEPSEPTALSVGTSPRWRTWTWRDAPEEPGNYRAILETVDGEQIAELPFQVVK